VISSRKVPAGQTQSAELVDAMLLVVMPAGHVMHF